MTDAAGGAALVVAGISAAVSLCAGRRPSPRGGLGQIRELQSFAGRRIVGTRRVGLERVRVLLHVAHLHIVCVHKRLLAKPIAMERGELGPRPDLEWPVMSSSECSAPVLCELVLAKDAISEIGVGLKGRGVAGH